MSFTLISDQSIPEINSSVHLYRHDRTGARLLSVINQDENKVFGIAFRTPPRTSNGIAHILEHTVLGGSRKYPVKDPFMELAKGSLQTFLNAFTYPDKTIYPVASQNVKDLYNLADVYLDAVLHPILSEQKFRQEGWHLEPGEPPAILKFNGIVYNEMKGFSSSPDELIKYDLSQRSLYPDTPYGLNSGGDPAVIPDLTYEEFLDFHRSYYHPTNSYIYFYGDDDPNERLRFIDGWLAEYDYRLVDSCLPLQTPFITQRKVQHVYDSGSNPDARCYLTINWLLPQTGDPLTMLSFAILAHLLTATPASPLRKTLIDSGLGEEITGPGLDDSLRQMYFSTGLKGIRPDNIKKVETLIIDTLNNLAKEGIDPESVAASLNTIEFQLREKSNKELPSGLVMFLSALTSWIHDGDPLAVLAFAHPLQTIKDRLASGEPYFENLIREHLIENYSRATVLLKPDPEQGKRLEAAETTRLEKISSNLSASALKSITREVEELKRLQETPDTPEALATIPMLKMNDLDPTSKVIPIEVKRTGEPKVFFHRIPTNGIVYLDVGFDLHPIPADLLPFIGLFGRILLEMGTSTHDYVSLTQQIGRLTGGITGETLTSGVRSSDRAELWFFLRGKALAAQANELLEIMKEVLISARFDDKERFRQIVLEDKARLEATLHPLGARFINRRLRARFHTADRVLEQTSGLEYLFFLRQLTSTIDKDWAFVLDKLERLQRQLINQRTMMINITSDLPSFEAFHPRLDIFIQTLPAFAASPGNLALPCFPDNEGFTIPSQVNYVGKGANLYTLGIEPHGSITVINNYLNNTWLFEKVRLQGGAYGGFCRFDTTSGIFTFLSYRDPNLLTTLENYDQSPHFLERLDLSKNELTKAIIGAIGEIDTYLPPDARGWTSMVRHLTGYPDEVRQHIREEILGTTVGDFRRFAAALDQVKTEGKMVVLGSEEAIKKANTERPGLLEMVKLL